MNEFIEWGALANIIVLGVVIGAGLPTVFAVGVRSLHGKGARDKQGRVKPGRIAVGVLCFGAVLLAIGFAISYLVAGGHA